MRDVLSVTAAMAVGALLGFFVVGREDWTRWFFCLLGFVLTRFAVQWLTQPPREDRTRSTPEAGYAP